MNSADTERAFLAGLFLINPDHVPDTPHTPHNPCTHEDSLQPSFCHIFLFHIGKGQPESNELRRGTVFFL